MHRTKWVVAACTLLVLGAGCPKDVQRELENAVEAAGNALEEAGKAVANMAEEGYREVKSLVVDEDLREQFFSDMTARVDKIARDINKITDKAVAKGGEVASTVSDLASDERKARMLLEELKSTSRERWDDAKVAYEKAVDALDTAVERAAEEVE